MSPHTDICSAVLAGGKSARMGRDKAFLKHGGVPFVRLVVDTLAAVCPPVFVVAGDGDRFRSLGVPVVEDIFRDSGPLGGIHAALSNSVARRVYIASCDTPFLSPEVVRSLLQAQGSEDVTVAATGDRVHPLCGIYSIRILPLLEEYLKQGRLSVLGFLSDPGVAVRARQIGAAHHAALTNINTPGEYLRHCAGAASGAPHSPIGTFQKESMS